MTDVDEYYLEKDIETNKINKKIKHFYQIFIKGDNVIVVYPNNNY